MSAFDEPKLIFTQRDGYAPPRLGGPVNVKWGIFDIGNDSENPAALFTLPAGAQIVGWVVAPTEAFNAGTTAVVDLGDGATADRFAADIDLKGAGLKSIASGFAGPAMFAALEEDTTVYATYSESGTAGTTGAAVVGVLYALVAR